MSQAEITRALAFLNVMISVLWATSRIGEPTSGDPITWSGAWLYVTVVATSTYIGWAAGYASGSGK